VLICVRGYSQTTTTSASTGGISVLSSSSFRDGNGAYYIVGEVKNKVGTRIIDNTATGQSNRETE
jgi:hypothetical protein